MLRTPHALAQATAIAGWAGSMAVNPYLLDPVCLSGWVAFFCMPILLMVCFTATSLKAWRICVLLFVAAQAYAFRQQALAMGPEVAQWILPVGLLSTFGVITLYVRLVDYVIGVLLVWASLWVGLTDHVADRSWPLFVLVVTTSVVLGAVLNTVFMRAILDSLRLQEDYRRQARSDSLTGIANRRALMEAIEEAHATGDAAWAFVMLDIDDFKVINDRHGHDVGDAVLCTAARTFDRHFGGEHYGRLGGEEFGVLLRIGSTSTLAMRLQLLFDDIAQLRSEEMHFTFSAGAAYLQPSGTVSDWLKAADCALYLAKRAGKRRAYCGQQELCRFQPCDAPVTSANAPGRG